jgi:nucleoside-diphosphate-sugar epimerase
MTHHTDFAKGFVGLMGNSRAIGDAFHITSDEWLNWNQIYTIFAHAAGVPTPQLVHIPSELINAYDANLGAGLLGDKAASMIFDNSKVKRLVPDFLCTTPLRRGAEEVLAWYDADPARQVVDERMDQLMDQMINAYRRSWPQS